jgi:hypothetical protein
MSLSFGNTLRYVRPDSWCILFEVSPKAIRKYDNKAYGHRWRCDRGFSGRLLPTELKGTEN